MSVARSEEKRLRYTGFLTDVNSKAYNSVIEMEPYVGHPHWKGRVYKPRTQEDGKLTQNFYKYWLAILSNNANIQDLEAMTR